jgi:hypothetical protein
MKSGRILSYCHHSIPSEQREGAILHTVRNFGIIQIMIAGTPKTKAQLTMSLQLLRRQALPKTQRNYITLTKSQIFLHFKYTLSSTSFNLGRPHLFTIGHSTSRGLK